MSSRTARDLVWEPRDRRAAPRAAHSYALGAAASAKAAAASDAVPRPEHPLPAHAQALYLLHLGAEIEHALMVQYLYAAFSLGGPQVPPEHTAAVERWRKTITEIAREEMGHLATVENMLQMIGGALCFDREDFPNPSPFYPFPFELEPLTRESLAKYVLAEMPPKETMSPELRAEIEEIELQIPPHEGRVNRVGLLYAALIDLFEPTPLPDASEHPRSIDTADMLSESVGFQASAEEWGLGYDRLLILQASERSEAVNALGRVAEQGEGITKAASGDASDASHFARFLGIYREFPPAGSWLPSRPLPTNPTTRAAPNPDPVREANRITDLTARRWAQLGNVRYAMLLRYLVHAFSTESPLANGERSSRGLLISWAFGEMYNLRSIADILARLPRRAGGGLDTVAGLPFELPYTLALPQRETDRWRVHRDHFLTSRNLLTPELPEAPLAQLDPAHARFIAALGAADQRALEIVMTAIGR